MSQAARNRRRRNSRLQNLYRIWPLPLDPFDSDPGTPFPLREVKWLKAVRLPQSEGHWFAGSRPDRFAANQIIALVAGGNLKRGGLAIYQDRSRQANRNRPGAQGQCGADDERTTRSMHSLAHPNEVFSGPLETTLAGNDDQPVDHIDHPGNEPAAFIAAPLRRRRGDISP
jgi:hypothetical protein